MGLPGSKAATPGVTLGEIFDLSETVSSSSQDNNTVFL